MKRFIIPVILILEMACISPKENESYHEKCNKVTLLQYIIAENSGMDDETKEIIVIGSLKCKPQ